MPALATALDARSPAYLANRAAMVPGLGWLTEVLAAARSGGGQQRVTHHHAQGKLLARERIELLVDRTTPLLELSPTAAWGTDCPVGAGVVTAIGIVEGTPCVIIANDPTVRDGAVNRYTVRKSQRATDIARANRLPLVNLVESVGPEPSAGQWAADPGQFLCGGLAQLASAGVTTVAVVFGEAAAGGAFVPGLSDHVIVVRGRSRVPVPEAVRPDGTAGHPGTGRRGVVPAPYDGRACAGRPGPRQRPEPGPQPRSGPATWYQHNGAGPGGHRHNGAGPGGHQHNGAGPGADEPDTAEHRLLACSASTDGVGALIADDDRDAIRLARSIIARLAGHPLPPPGHHPAHHPAGRCPVPARPPAPEPPRHDPSGLLAVIPADPQAPVDPHEILARVLDGSRFDEYEPDSAPALCAGWGTVHGYPVAVLADGHRRAWAGSTGEARAAGQKAGQFVRLVNASTAPLLVLCDSAGAPDEADDEWPAVDRYASPVMDAAAASLVAHLTLHLGPVTGGGGDHPRFRFRWPGACRRAAASGGPPPGPDLVDDDGVIDPRDTRTVLGLCLAVMADEQWHNWTGIGGVESPWPRSTGCGFRV